MSETMITALVTAGATMLVSIITLVVNASINSYKSKLDIQHKMYQSKRENLNDVYKTLISIVNLYPKKSPNDVLKYVEDAPCYLLESFDSVIMSLDDQIEDYKNQLNIENLNYHRKIDVKTKISKREYSKKNILEIRDKYFDARDRYKEFCEKEKVIFDLYAGQEVRNSLVQFELMIHNIFISGYSVGAEPDDPLKNCVEICKRELINSMRYDIGIN